MCTKAKNLNGPREQNDILLVNDFTKLNLEKNGTQELTKLTHLQISYRKISHIYFLDIVIHTSPHQTAGQLKFSVFKLYSARPDLDQHK
jgi:hypothetical protein